MLPAEPALIDCYCRACRTWSASAYGCLLPLDFLPDAFAAARSYDSDCGGGLGRLRRLFCGDCRAHVGALPLDGSVPAYAAAGCVVDASLPEAVAAAWRTPKRVLAAERAPAWWTARPSDDRTAPPRVLSGRCACGRRRRPTATFERSFDWMTHRRPLRVRRRVRGRVPDAALLLQPVPAALRLRRADVDPGEAAGVDLDGPCLLYTSPSPRDRG